MIQTIALTFAVVDGLDNEVAQLIEPGKRCQPHNREMDPRPQFGGHLLMMVGVLALRLPHSLSTTLHAQHPHT